MRRESCAWPWVQCRRANQELPCIDVTGSSRQGHLVSPRHPSTTRDARRTPTYRLQVHRVLEHIDGPGLQWALHVADDWVAERQGAVLRLRRADAEGIKPRESGEKVGGKVGGVHLPSMC